MLVALSGRYGPNRDELYFVQAGENLAWAYPDQGVLTPLVARLMDEIAPGSLVALRLPAAVAVGVIVALAGLLARELGGRRRAELIAAACTATGVVFLQTGHTLGTTTFDLLVWAAVTWLAVRALRTDEDRLWPVAGLVLGMGLLNKPLRAFLAAGLLAGVLIAGPRKLLRSRWVWAGAGKRSTSTRHDVDVTSRGVVKPSAVVWCARAARAARRGPGRHSSTRGAAEGREEL